MNFTRLMDKKGTRSKLMYLFSKAVRLGLNGCRNGSLHRPGDKILLPLYRTLKVHITTLSGLMTLFALSPLHCNMGTEEMVYQ